MNGIALDTYAFITSLKNAGLTEPQAKAIADGFKQANLDHLATKEDIQVLRNEIASLKAELLKWLVPMLLGQTALFAALVKLM